jgi:uncharacterized protein YndB with AHSA1/START domain
MDQVKTAHIVQEHVINAPKARVFKALTQEVGTWWSHGFEKDSKISLDLRLGGHFKEEYKNGGGCLFAVVRWWRPDEAIELEGSMAFDGAVQGLFSYTLEEKGGTTLIKFEHKFFGMMSDEAKGQYNQGWDELLGRDLKNWIENGKPGR